MKPLKAPIVVVRTPREVSHGGVQALGDLPGGPCCRNGWLRSSLKPKRQGESAGSSNLSSAQREGDSASGERREPFSPRLPGLLLKPKRQGERMGNSNFLHFLSAFLASEVSKGFLRCRRKPFESSKGREEGQEILISHPSSLPFGFITRSAFASRVCYLR